jgi:uncharacterized protein YcfJ
MKIFNAIALCTATVMLSACVTMAGREQTVLERSISECIASIGIGAVVGAVFGSLAGRPGRGAAIGAGVGTVACGVLIAINNARDKQRIRDAEQRALNTGRDTTEQFVGNDGQTRIVQTSVQDVETPPELVAGVTVASRPATTGTTAGVSTAVAPSSPTTFVGPCRMAQSKITVKGETAQLPSEVLCRTSQGDWLPYNATAT